MDNDEEVYTPEKFGAIGRSIELGRTLQLDLPEVADLYRKYNLAQIVNILNIKSRYGVNDKVAINGVQKAIAGYDGRFKIEGKDIERYEGLITDLEERRELRTWHKTNGGRNRGLLVFSRGTGIFERTREEHFLDSREGGLNSMINQGKTPWMDAERESAYELSLIPEYTHRLIARELNDEYHDGNKVRWESSVCTELSRYRKSLREKVES